MKPPEIPNAATFILYTPEHRATLVRIALEHVGEPMVQGSTSWWATAVLTYEHMLRQSERLRIVP